MDLRSSRSRSKTPFTQVESIDREVIEGSHLEKSVTRTTRTTTFTKYEGVASSSDEVTSFEVQPARRSTRSERNIKRLYNTSDYSSEDGENEVSSTKTITQNERNQFIEDAKAAANGNKEVSALNLYKKSGRYWDVYPKTDWTYSYHSKDRVELAPGVVAMPNMSRKTIHSVHGSDSLSSYANKETNTESSAIKANSYITKNESYSDYKPRQLFNNNYSDAYKTYTKTNYRYSRLVRLRQSIVRLFTSIYTSILTIFYYLFEVQTSWFAKLHQFTSRVMLLDTWLLRKTGAGHKSTKLLLLCLVPLFLLGGAHVLLASGVPLAPSCHPNCGRIASTYFNSLITEAYTLLNFTESKVLK